MQDVGREKPRSSKRCFIWLESFINVIPIVFVGIPLAILVLAGWGILAYESIIEPDDVFLYCQENFKSEGRESFILVISQKRVESDNAEVRVIRSETLFESVMEQSREIEEWTEAKVAFDYVWENAVASLDLIVAKASEQNHSTSRIVLNRYTGKVSIEEIRENGETYLFEGTCLSKDERKF